MADIGTAMPMLAAFAGYKVRAFAQSILPSTLSQKLEPFYSFTAGPAETQRYVPPIIYKASKTIPIPIPEINSHTCASYPAAPKLSSLPDPYNTGELDYDDFMQDLHSRMLYILMICFMVILLLSWTSVVLHIKYRQLKPGHMMTGNCRISNRRLRSERNEFWEALGACLAAMQDNTTPGGPVEKGKEDANANKSALLGKIETLKEYVLTVKTKVETLKKQEESVEEEVGKLQAKKTGVKKDLEELQTEKTDVEEYLKRLQTEKTTAEEDLKELKKGKTDVEEDLKKLQEKKTVVEKDFEKLQREKTAAEKGFDKLSEEKTAAEKGFEKLKEEKTDVEKDFKKIQEEKAVAEEGIKKLQGGQTAVREDLKRLQGRKEAVKEDLKKLRGEKKVAEEEEETKVSTLTTTIKELKREKKDVEGLKDQAIEAQSKLAKTNEELLKDIENLKVEGQEQASIAQEHDELKQQIQALNKAKDDAEAQVSSMSSKNKHLAEMNEQLTRLGAATQECNERRAERIETLEAQVKKQANLLSVRKTQV